MSVFLLFLKPLPVRITRNHVTVPGRVTSGSSASSAECSATRLMSLPRGRRRGISVPGANGRPNQVDSPFLGPTARVCTAFKQAPNFDFMSVCMRKRLGTVLVVCY